MGKVKPQPRKPGLTAGEEVWLMNHVWDNVPFQVGERELTTDKSERTKNSAI